MEDNSIGLITKFKTKNDKPYKMGSCFKKKDKEYEEAMKAFGLRGSIK